MAKKVLRPVDHDAQLSLVEHLDELRTRLIICIAALTVVFGLCFWQNDRILDIVNKPVQDTAFKKTNSQDPLEQAAQFQLRSRDALIANAAFLRSLASDDDMPAASRTQALAAARSAEAAARAAPETNRNGTVSISGSATRRSVGENAGSRKA